VRGEPDLSEFADATELAELRKLVPTLQRQLRKAKAKTEDLVEATILGAKDAMAAYGPIKPVAAPSKDRRRKSPEVALWDLGDWQGAKRTTTYNSEVMRERVMRYWGKARKITEIQRADHTVRDCTIIFGGDMVEGLFNFPTQPHEVDQTIFGQYVTVSRLLVDTVRYALSLYEQVTVVAEWGNHGRIGSKRDCVPRSDNVDRMCYELARQLLEGEPRLTWEDCPEDIQRLEIGNYRALVIHADEIGRNGFASPTTIANWVVRQKSGAYPWKFRDCYIHHYHTHAEFALPDGAGAIYQNGSTESDNRYAGVTMAASAVPSQRLHFIDPEEGRVTGQYKVWVHE
jgi:hypothetical protein